MSESSDCSCFPLLVCGYITLKDSIEVQQLYGMQITSSGKKLPMFNAIPYVDSN